MQRTTTCLAFKRGAEDAADLYVSVFDAVFGNSGIVATTHYGEEELATLAADPQMTAEMLPGPAGSVKTVRFTLDGQGFVAFNGGNYEGFGSFSESVSLYVDCETQEQIDYLWEKLSEGGAELPCGWLQDRFGVYWQIAPRIVWEAIEGPDRARAQRVSKAVYAMTKLDIAAIKAVW